MIRPLFLKFQGSVFLKILVRVPGPLSNLCPGIGIWCIEKFTQTIIQVIAIAVTYMRYWNKLFCFKKQIHIFIRKALNLGKILQKMHWNNCHVQCYFQIDRFGKLCSNFLNKESIVQFKEKRTLSMETT